MNKNFFSALAVASRESMVEESLALKKLAPMPVSPALEAAIRDACRRSRKAQERAKRHQVYRIAGKRLFQVAAIVALLACLMYMTVSGFRTAVHNIAESVKDEVTSFVVRTDGSRLMVADAYSGYVPEGMECEISIVDPTGINRYAKYKGSRGWFAFTQAPLSSANGEIGIRETEQEIEINGFPGKIVSVRKDEIAIYWYSEQFYYKLTGSLEKDELIKMAQSQNIT